MTDHTRVCFSIENKEFYENSSLQAKDTKSFLLWNIEIIHTNVPHNAFCQKSTNVSAEDNDNES